MSVFNAKNMLSVLIGKNIARTGSVQITDPSAAAYIADGEIVVVDLDGTVLDSATCTVGINPKIRLVQRSGATAATAKLIYSPIITGRGVVAYTGEDGAVATEQVTNIGYNGSAGNIDTSATDDFLFTIAFTHDESMWSTQGHYEPFLIENTGSMTEAAVATSLAEQINYKMVPPYTSAIAGEGPLVRATILCNNAGAAITGTGTITARQGSKTITAGTDIDAIMAVGDYIRIASTATTGAVYEIVSMDTTANTAQLNMAFQGTTVVASAEGNHEFISAANMATADCGVVITGQTLKWTLDHFKYQQVTFRTSMQNFGTTTTATTAAVRAKGTGQQVAELESFAAGFDGVLNRTIIPLPDGRSDADQSASTVYDIITIVWEDTSDGSPVDGSHPSRQELKVCVIDGASQLTTANFGIKTVLDAYMASVPLALPAASI